MRVRRMLHHAAVKGRVDRAHRIDVDNFRIHDIARDKDADAGQHDAYPLEPITARRTFRSRIYRTSSMSSCLHSQSFTSTGFPLKAAPGAAPRREYPSCLRA